MTPMRGWTGFEGGVLMRHPRRLVVGGLFLSSMVLAGCGVSRLGYHNASNASRPATVTTQHNLPVLLTLDMRSVQQGWALSSKGDIYWTTNGGRAWQLTQQTGISPSTPHTVWLSGNWHRTSWIVLWHRGSRVVRLWTTRDAGQRWNALDTTLPASASINAESLMMSLSWFDRQGTMVLVTPNHNPSVGIWQLHPDHHSWQPVKTVFDFAHVSGMQFLSPSTGYAVGFLPMANASPLWATHNGGRTWDVESLSRTIQEKGWQLQLTTPIVTGTMLAIPELWLGSRPAQMSFALRTSTGWTQTSLVPASTRVAWANSQDAWVLTPEQLWMTQNGGSTWRSTVAPFLSQTVMGIDFVNGTTGWVWSIHKNHTILWATDNAGASWQRLVP